MADNEPNVTDDNETVARTKDSYDAGYRDAAFESRAQLGMITAQLTNLNRFATGVRNLAELFWYAIVGALLGFVVGKILLAILS